ncbi:hypothetical protein [uncultured Fibrella sp.]|uniref:hypothetical protein n=1 Tax=uncultured Fibrella sp. TaxID=1284596 RepID=UPI0035CBE060
MELHHIPFEILKVSILSFITLFASTTGSAQSLGGTSWQGRLVSTQNQSLSYPATVTFSVVGTELTGSVIMESQGVKDLYVLQGRAKDGQAAGTATYPKDGSIFQFEAQLTGAQLAFAVGLNNTPIMTGTLTRLGAGGREVGPQARANVPDQQRAQDRLPRNNRLMGVWVYSSTYRSGGDFRFTSRSFLYFYPDGRLGSSTGEAAASYDGAAGSSYMNTGADGVTIEPGVVWYTKGNQIWLHATQQKVADGIWGDYFINDNGSGMHLNRGRGNKLYERVN